MANLIKYPEVNRLLKRLADEDQLDIRGHYERLKAAKDNKAREEIINVLKSRLRERTEKLINILGIIKAPTIGNIGLDGSKNVAILTLHSNERLIRKVLKLYETEFKTNPGNIYYQAIPPLKDRISIYK